MKIGDIVYLKSYKSMVGEVRKIDDMDRATLSLYVILGWRLL